MVAKKSHSKKTKTAPAANEAVRWCEAFAHYLASECHLAANTVEAYRRDLHHFFSWLAGRKLQQLTVRQLAHYPSWLIEQNLAPASISRHVVSLKMFFRYLQLEGVLLENHAELLGTQKLWERVPEVLSQKQVDQLLKAPRASDPFYLRDRALLEMMYASGCRVSEISHMRLREMQLEEGYCRAHGKGDKQRVVPVGQSAREAIKAYLKEERPSLAGRKEQADPGYLFLSARGQRLRRERIWELFKKYAARVGASPRLSPHSMRHSFATHMLAGGADLRHVQELLGHASIATTQIYTHVDLSRLKSVHEQFHPRG